MAATSIIDQIDSGQVARLIPTVVDSKKEERATSSLLASFMVVPAFAQDVLSTIGAPTGKRVRVKCYTEVVFKSKKDRKSRPDGLLVVTSGSNEWSALIESKIGTAELRSDQIEDYLDLAREVGANAVITLSNQFATLPTHHPVQISKQKTRTVGLYHFSWLSLVSKAILIADNKRVDDSEQAYILKELVRYLQHDSSGVTSLTSMGKGWRELCGELLQGAAINRKSDYVEQSVASWQQLLRYLSIRLSVAIGKPVSVYLSRARVKDPNVNYEEDVSGLLKDGCLGAEFEIPDAASRLAFSADILRRTINLSMKLEAPKDKSLATASINWFTRQLRGVEGVDLMVRAYWPRRIAMTGAPLAVVLENPKVLLPENVSELPVALEVVRVVDLMARFRGSRTFVEEAEKAFLEFYAKVGQRLIQWIPKAPKVKEVQVVDAADVMLDAEDIGTEFTSMVSESTQPTNATASDTHNVSFSSDSDIAETVISDCNTLTCSSSD
jgi:hypothetical protein